MKKIIFVVLLVFTGSINAATAVGTIEEIYSSSDGTIALKLNEGFNSTVISECPTYNGYAGNLEADPFLKSMLLAAFVSKQKIKLKITGCSSNNAWLNIISTSVYSN